MAFQLPSMNDASSLTTPLLTTRCTIVQSAVLRLHVVCPSVCNFGGSGSHRLEILEANCTDNSLFVAQRPSTYSQGNMGNFEETRAQKRQYLRNS